MLMISGLTKTAVDFRSTKLSLESSSFMWHTAAYSLSHLLAENFLPLLIQEEIL